MQQLELAFRIRPQLVLCGEVRTGDLVRYGLTICRAAPIVDGSASPPVLWECCTPRWGFWALPAERLVVMLRRG